MIGNIVPVSGPQAKQYPFEESQGYYQGQEHEMMPPSFGGSFAQELGLTPGTFDKAAYERAIDGDFETDLENNRENNIKRAAYDVTISAPKSVSIAGLVLGDDRVVQAHNEANLAAMAMMESFVKYRTKEGEKIVTHDAAGIAFASFGHISSRERQQTTALEGHKLIIGPGGDPQIHTHNIVFKMIKGQDGTLRALENSEMLLARKMVDQHYKKVLSDKLQEIGYEIEHTKDGFEIKGIDKQLMTYLSSGRNSIDAALAAQGLTRETSSSEQRDLTNKTQRQSKRHYELDNLKDWWHERIAAEGFAQPSIESLTQSQTNTQHLRPAPTMTATEAVDAAVESLTERSMSMKHRYVIAEEAMKASNLTISLDDVNAEIDQQIAKGDIVKRRDVRSYTSAKLVETERSIESFYKDGIDKVAPITTYAKASEHIAAAEDRLREAARARGDYVDDTTGKFTAGQREMVLAAATNKDAVFVIVGDAGTGKSVGVSALYAAAQAEGCNVIGLAGLTRAVDALGESIKDARTLQGSLHNKKFWANVNEGTVIVLDEAGIVDSRSMATLMAKLEEKRQSFAAKHPDRPIAGPRLVLLGDDKQYGAVEAGSPFYQLKQLTEKQGAMVNLTEMRRGSEEKAFNGTSIHDLHYLARDNPELLLAKMQDAGLVTALGTEKARLAYLGREYAKMSPELQEKSLVLTGTNATRVAINTAIRKKMGLERGVKVETFERKDLTKPQTKNIANYEVGDVMRVGMAVKTDRYKKGDFLEIVGKEDDRVLVRKNGSEDEFVFTPSKMGHRVSLGTSEQLEISRGDLLRFTGKLETLGIANGDRARVVGIDKDEGKMRVRLVDTGAEVDVDLRERGLSVRYGYAATGHSAQGVTAGGKVFKYSVSDDPTVNRNSTYTDLTRSKVHYEIVTDTIEGERIEALSRAMARETAKETALMTPRQETPKAVFKLYEEKGFRFVSVVNPSDKNEVEKALTEATARFKNVRVVGNNDFRFAVVKAAVATHSPVVFKDRKTKKLEVTVRKSLAAREAQILKSEELKQRIAEPENKMAGMIKKSAQFDAFAKGAIVVNAKDPVRTQNSPVVEEQKAQKRRPPAPGRRQRQDGETQGGQKL